MTCAAFSRNIVLLPSSSSNGAMRHASRWAGSLSKKANAMQGPGPDQPTWPRFFRELRALRLSRSHRVVSRMKRDFLFVRLNYDAVIVGSQLFVFLLRRSAIVCETQHGYNPGIGNNIGALYFMVAMLITTGSATSEMKWPLRVTFRQPGAR